MTEIHPVTEIDYNYTWNFENRLVKVKKAGSGSNDSLRMFYCGLGKRIMKIHGAADTTSYAYDGMYAVCEFGGHLDLKAKYVYANGMLLARYDASPADSHYYHHDGLGSIMGMTNENGSVEQSYFYDEFGNSLGSWGGVSNHFLYTGQNYDTDVSGAEQYNLRARYYKTGIGRFTSEDPELSENCSTQYKSINSRCNALSAYTFPGKHEPIILNRFTYVTNNAVNISDPTGLLPKRLCFPIAILKAYYKTAGKENAEMKHCVYSCEIARECGSLLSAIAGVTKEVVDYIGSKTKRWPGHASLADLGLDMVGIGCSNLPDPCTSDKPWDCLECCKKALGY